MARRRKIEPDVAAALTQAVGMLRALRADKVAHSDEVRRMIALGDPTGRAWEHVAERIRNTDKAWPGFANMSANETANWIAKFAEA